MAQPLIAQFNAGTISGIREKTTIEEMTMRIRALYFLVGLLIISSLLTATFALDNASAVSFDRRVEQAGRIRERPTSAPGGGSTNGKDSKMPQMECIYLHRSRIAGGPGHREIPAGRTKDVGTMAEEREEPYFGME
jgi:hypothetical protein